MQPSIAQLSLVALLAVAPHTAHAQLATPVITTLPGGRVQVKNTGPSKWVGTTGWKLVLERTIAPEDGSPGMLERPSRIAVAKDGQLVVYDAGKGLLLQFAADGRFLRRIGAKGEGPGEYGYLLDSEVRDDIIIGNDPNLRRLIMWKTDGSFIRQWATPPNNCGAGPTLLGVNGSVLIPSCITNGKTGRGAIVRFSSTGQALDTMFMPVLAYNPTVWRMPNGAVQRVPFSTGQVGTFDSKFRYVYGLNDAYSLFVANRGTDTARIIQLPGSRQTISTKLVDSLFDRTQRGALKGIAKRSDYPREHGFFVGLHEDEFDNIWIDRPGPDGKAAQFDVIDRDGRFLGSVLTPAGLSRGAVWRNGRMYRASENADGLPVIEVFRVERGKY